MMIRNRQSNHARLVRTASALSLAAALTFGASAAYAQDAAAPAEGEEEDIIVTGYASALENAVEVKRDADQIVESVSAEDIGRLPDASIGEAIARLPGLTSQRNNGRASGIAIRGFGPDFSTTLLNGREQTTTSDNRSVEFDQYPSEIVSRVDVFKSPTADLVGAGLVGTVDIRTIRPLETNDRILAIGGRVSYADLGALNAGSEDIGYRANATYVDQFADDTIGIALAMSYVNEPYQNQEFNAWGYTGGVIPGADLIGGSKSFVTSTSLERIAFNGTLQWEPAPEVRVTFDGFYSQFTDEQFKRGIELPLGFSVNGDNPATPIDERLVPGFFSASFLPSSAVVQNGQVVSGRFPTVEGVVRNDIFERRADLYSFGFNTAYTGDNGWNVMFDVGYSRTDRNELSLESYAGTGFGAGNGALDSISFVSGPTGTTFTPTLNYSNPALILLTDPLGWGGGVVPQAGYYNNRIIDDELMSFRTEVEREFENSNLLRSVQFGLAYTSREKTLTPDEAFVRLPAGTLQRAIPAQYLQNPTNLAYLGLGPIVSYDPRDLLRDGVLLLEPRVATGPGAAFDVIGKGYTINEDVMTAYLQFNIESELGIGTLTGNVGVQAIHTDQSSTGFINSPTGPLPRTLGDEYWDILPSLNLSLRLPSDTVIRFAASRQMMRPRLDQMRISIGYGYNTGLQVIGGSGGNPFLRPYRANAVDLNIEQYFGRGGVIAAQFFYKDITSFVFDGRFPFDYAGFPTPIGTPPGTPTLGFLDAPINTGGGPLYGAELGITLPLSNLTPALDGFGITGGVSWTESRVEDAGGNRTTIPGYSRWVANGTAYFERWGFNARGSVRYRSTFLGDFTGFGGSPTRRQALEELIVDAQIGYDFQEGSALHGLSLYLQGQNLTDERFAAVASTDRPLSVIDYQIYGRRFLAGFTFRF